MLTKRGILAKLAKIYDPLGLVSPETLSGKLIYRAVCDTKKAWDAELPRDLAKAWIKWESRLLQSFEVPRSLALHREGIEYIELHSFGDACANGVAACIYGVIRQASGTNQGLIAARSRLSKQGLAIPRLDLVAGHMAVNLVANARNALDGLPISSTHCWLDSSVALRRGKPEWIYSDNGRTFVGAAEWMKTVMKDERLQTYLSTNQIKWQFNLSRAPCWGGQFERMISLVKTALNKTIGNGLLRWEELQEVLLDVEINLNNRPLSYVEEEGDCHYDYFLI